MNYDLISREALKKAIEEYKYCGFYDKLIEIIDNAPTVFSCNACKNMGNERECVDCHDYSNYVHYEERPQGEWIHYLGCGVGKAVCSKCNQIGETKEYCGNCGAKMRKGGAE